MTRENLPCSFCGEMDVLVMITGPNVNICDECVKTCREIIIAHEQWAYRKEVEKAAFYELWGTDV